MNHPEDSEDRDCETLSEMAVRVLQTKDTDEKARLTQLYADAWLNGETAIEVGNAEAPLIPARPDYVEIRSFRDMPKRGKGGTLSGRIAMIHSLVHIESVAIDLSWDIIARFTSAKLPKEFYDDFVKVAQDESRHYSLLKQRLEELGSSYGSLPAHDGLWQSALESKDSILVRLAIEHMVHEARGLDVTPTTIHRLRAGGDEDSASLLENHVLTDEITHVAAGIKWFRYICSRDDPLQDPIPRFHEIVRQVFR